MRRTVVAVMVLGCLAIGVNGSDAAGVGQAAAPAAAQVSAADAAPFLGEWTLTGSGQNGPATFNLTLKMDGAKLTGEISSDLLATTVITDITKSEKSLVLRYSFDYQGTPVATVVTLTPAADGKLTGSFDFAGGAAVMDVSGTRKPAK